MLCRGDGSPRPRRGRSAETRRRARDVDGPRRRVAATPPPRRGQSAETRRRGRDVGSPRRRRRRRSRDVDLGSRPARASGTSCNEARTPSAAGRTRTGSWARPCGRDSELGTPKSGPSASGKRRSWRRSSALSSNAADIARRSGAARPRPRSSACRGARAAAASKSLSLYPGETSPNASSSRRFGGQNVGEMVARGVGNQSGAASTPRRRRGRVGSVSLPRAPRTIPRRRC